MPFLAPPPPPFRAHRVGSALLWVHPDVESWAVEVVRSGQTLHGWALEHSVTLPSGPLTGRGIVPVVALPPTGSRYAVRHLTRGGWLFPLLHDRFLGSAQFRLPRAFRELLASEACRALGIPTPPVRVAAVYRSGAVHRGDLVTEYLDDTLPLTALLDGGGTGAIEAMERTGALLRLLADHGIHHPDLNVKNLLFRRGKLGWDGWVLDLDGAQVRPPGTRRPPRPDLSPSGRRMAARFRRSLRKWEASRGTPLPPSVWEAFERILQ